MVHSMNEPAKSFYTNNNDEQENPSVINPLPPSLKRGYESPAATTSDESGSGYVFESYKAEPLWTKIKARGKQNQSRMSSYILRLCQAVSLNDTETVDLLLTKGVPANCADHHKRTPLHLAACKGYASIVRKLLDYGADPNARDSIGNTALHLAACTHNINVVLLLLKAGTDARSRDTLGRSPLQLAESKLKILQQSHFPDQEIKAQVSQVIEMLMHFSSKDDSLDSELLASFKSKVQLSDTREKVDSQLKNLLESIGSLSIKS